MEGETICYEREDPIVYHDNDYSQVSWIKSHFQCVSYQFFRHLLLPFTPIYCGKFSILELYLIRR
jgi:hypothetical protein